MTTLFRKGCRVRHKDALPGKMLGTIVDPYPYRLKAWWVWFDGEDKACATLASDLELVLETNFDRSLRSYLSRELSDAQV